MATKPKKAKAEPQPEAVNEQETGRNIGGVSELRSFIERFERIAKEIEDLQSDRKDLKAEARSRGWNIKSIEKVLQHRSETDADRELRAANEQQAEIYLAALGHLDGTPLGEATRERLSKAASGQEPPEEGEATRPPIEPPNACAVEDARERGREAMRAGERVTGNPYLAGDPRRAAWDEGWCLEAGSDGMDIPNAWKRPETAPKKGKKKDAASAEGER